MNLLLMGVTGSGKSTVGGELARRLGWVFLEADDFHSVANKKKMSGGVPLTDAERIPWLDSIHAELQAQKDAGNSVVLGCSALKEDYRRRLTTGLDVTVVYLKGSQELIAERLRRRTDHFAGEVILEDQFAVLEEPRDAVVVDIAEAPEQVVEEILRKLALSTISPEVSAKHLLGKMRWRLLPFLFLLYVVAYLDRINVGFAALQMKGQLGFSDAVYGFGAGIFFLGYFLFQVPSNVVLERVGARRWLGFLMVVWGVISSAMFLVHSVGSFYSLRFLLGVAEAGFFPGVIFYLRSWFPPAARAGVVALFATAGPVSGVVGGPISGALLDWNGLGGFAGWQWMFLIEGIPAVVLGIAAWLYLNNGPEEARWLMPEEKSWLKQNLSAGEVRPAATQAGGARAWFLSADLWRFAGVYFGLNTCSYGVSLWLPSALKSLSGLPNLLVGAVSAVPYLVATVIMVIVGVHSDHTRERRWHIALSAFAGAVALLIAGSSTGLVISVAAFGIALAASNSMVGPVWAMASATLAESTAARGIALINSIGNLGSGFGPYWIGYLRDATQGFRAGLWSVAGLLTLAGLTILSIRRAVPRGS
ncbi:MAG TPA: MFS transporter [Candidatus Limnocylindrales bacterium]|nr:MFS transporter [Candidatus Limnocylindrales bacterium]